METLHNLIGPTQSILILVVIALVLIFLIMKAIKQGNNKNQLIDQKTAPTSPTFEAIPPRPTSPQSSLEDAVKQKITDVSPMPLHRPSLDIQQAMKAYVSEVPEDSVLRRHYLTEKAVKKTELVDPIPTDSILRRHYEALHQPVVLSRPKKTTTIEQAVRQDASIALAAPLVTVTKSLQTDDEVKGKLPEDSVLKRHFISQLQAEIQLEFSVRPTDSVLRRHFDHLIGLELKKRLALKSF